MRGNLKRRARKTAPRLCTFVKTLCTFMNMRKAGSAKSTAAKTLRRLIDPNASALRSVPKDERDLFIAGSNAACLIYDNLSSIPPWLSDALCRVATGGGFATRALHTDSEEALFEVARPVCLTSVGDVIARSDLADRTIFMALGSIAKRRNRRVARVAISLKH